MDGDGLPGEPCGGKRKGCRQAVILSAGLGTRIAVVAQGRPKALIEVGALAAIVTQVRQLLGAGVRRIVVVHAAGQDDPVRSLFAHVFAHADVEFRFAVQLRPSGPLDALAAATGQIRPGDVTVLLADTLIENLADIPPDAVGVGAVDSAREFCIAHVDQAGRISEYEDKPDRDDGSDLAVAGVYRFGDADLLRTLLAEPAGSPELSDLLARYGARRQLTAVTVEGWRDLGSYERYLRASRSALAGRAGHGFAFEDDGTVTKRGEPSLMAAQARWYRELPDTAAGLAPRLFGAGEGWYRMELLDYPSLSQLLLYEPLPASTWSFLLRSLLETVEARLWGPTRQRDPALPAWCERKYIIKTERRLERWPEWRRLRDRRLIINGTELASFDELWPDAVRALRSLSSTAGQSCTIHGDMTFSNILLARHHGFFKLVDPGTTFSNSRGGDLRYDLAKLRQCYAGGYDSLSADLFSLSARGPGRWELRLFPRQSMLADLGDEILAGLGCDLTAVKLLEAIQFLSMVPLHRDNPGRQLALYARGLQLLAAVLEGRPDAIPVP